MTQTAGRNKIAARTPPVVQLLMTKCVVDIHYIPCKEHDDPQSNKYRTLLLVNIKETQRAVLATLWHTSLQFKTLKELQILDRQQMMMRVRQEEKGRTKKDIKKEEFAYDILEIAFMENDTNI